MDMDMDDWKVQRFGSDASVLTFVSPLPACICTEYLYNKT